MEGHSCGVGGAPLCNCAVCLILGRIGGCLLSPTRSREYCSYWTQRLRIFGSEVQESAALEDSTQGRVFLPPAAPPAEASF